MSCCSRVSFMRVPLEQRMQVFCYSGDIVNDSPPNSNLSSYILPALDEKVSAKHSAEEQEREAVPLTAKAGVSHDIADTVSPVSTKSAEVIPPAIRHGKCDCVKLLRVCMKGN